MAFQAIVHAPMLRRGARLNIADLDQTLSRGPRRLGLGSDVEMRLGVCSPQLRRGLVVDYVPLPESAVIAWGADEVTIRRGTGHRGSSQPGLQSEVWFVD